MTLAEQVQAVIDAKLVGDPKADAMWSALLPQLQVADGLLAAKAKANATRKRSGDITRDCFHQAAMQVVTAGMGMTATNLRTKWPAGQVIPEDAYINKLIRVWMLGLDPDWPGPVTLPE